MIIDFKQSTADLSDEDCKEHLRQIVSLCQSSIVASVQKNVIGLIEKLSKSHPLVVIKQLPVVLLSFVKQLSGSQPSPGLARTAILSVNLITACLSQLPNDTYTEENIKNLLLSQSVLTMSLFFPNVRRSVLHGTEKNLFALWKVRPNVLALLIKLLEKASPNASFLGICSLISRFEKISASKEGATASSELYNCGVQHFVKSPMFSGKICPSDLSLHSCADFLENCVTSDRFQRDILPVLQRSMLRSPEMCTRAVNIVLQKLSFDLASFCESLLFGANFSSSFLVTQLRSQTVEVRDNAASILITVFQKCFSSASRQRVMDILFDTVMDSPEAKKCTVEVKLHAWTIVGRLVAEPVTQMSGSHSQGHKLGGIGNGVIHKSNMADSTMEPLLQLLFQKVKLCLKQETNELVSVCAVESCTEWAYSYRSSSLDDTISWLKECGFQNKTPLAIRLALRCLMNALFRKADQMEALTPLIPSLLEYWQHCMRQVSGALVHSEAIITCALLLRYNAVYACGTTELSDNSEWTLFWKSLLNVDEKNSLAAWKIVSLTNSNVLLALVTVCDKLLRDFSFRLTPPISCATQQLFIQLICCQKNEKVRKAALFSLRQSLTFTSSGDSLAYHLGEQIDSWLTTVESQAAAADAAAAAGDSSEATANVPTSPSVPFKVGHMKDCLLTLTKFPETRLCENGEPVLLHAKQNLLSKLAVKCLFICCRPSVLSSYPDLWMTILKQMSVSNQKQELFIDLHKDYFIQHFIDLGTLNKVNENALILLVRYWPSQMIPTLYQQITMLLESQEFASVSLREMGILLTPPNVLFDSEFLSSLTTYDTESTANIKRENKAYSHRDQLAEIELRKEVEAKKQQQKKSGGPSGKGKVDSATGAVSNSADPYAKLTPKQREIVQEKLQAEQSTRARVNELMHRMSYLMNLMQTVTKFAAFALTDSLPQLTQLCCQHLLRSPLACVPAAQLFIELKSVPAEDLSNDVQTFNNHPLDHWLLLTAHWCTRVLQPVWCLAALQWPEKLLEKDLKSVHSVWHWIDAHHRPWLKTSLVEQTASVFAFLQHVADVKFSTEMQFVYTWPALNKLLRVSCERRILAKEKASDSAAQWIAQQKILPSCTGATDLNTVKQLLAEFDSLQEHHLITVLEIVRKYYKKKENAFLDPTDILPEVLPHADLLKTLQTLLEDGVGNQLEVLIREIFTLVSALCSGQEGRSFASWDTMETLLVGLMSPSQDVRFICAQCLSELSASIEHHLKVECPQDNVAAANKRQKLSDILYIILHLSKNEKTSELVHEIFTNHQLSVQPRMLYEAISYISHPVVDVRTAAAEAIAELLIHFPEKVVEIVSTLWKIYLDAFIIPPPVKDELGRVLIASPPDNWLPRWGVAKTLQLCCPSLSEESDLIGKLFHHLVDRALGDRNASVRDEMLICGRLFLDKYGKNMVATLLPILDEFLSNAPDEASYDNTRQSVIVLTGSLAQHLDPSDSKIRNILGKLVEALRINSQQVQVSVSEVMGPLMKPLTVEERSGLLERLMKTLFEGNGLAERRGAAFGIAGTVKGIGILVLKNNQIMERLIQALQEKNDPKKREGALFCVETLGFTLGKLFEPYIVGVIPHLLLAFGDQNSHVRKAANDAAKSIMSRLSAHGVKLVLPSLLAALEQDSWRTKSGSTELLGSMAYCAPRQLSACLPQIVPRLMDVLTDSHTKVQNSAALALEKIASVIKNPEIQALVPTLLNALKDPIGQTTPCLKILLNTTFVHVIDPASLAIIMPVLKRAFSDRVTDTKKMAAQIVGNMYSLADPKDLLPYMETLLPGLKAVLMDPEPSVRTIAAKALGSMVRESNDACFQELLPWLMTALASESSTVDRSGAAQGLAEVVGARGEEQLRVLMQDAIMAASNSNYSPHVRDGYIQLFTYLPDVFGNAFASYVGHILPPILKALSDESEYIRLSALQAGKSIIRQYSETSVELLLPRLEDGLLNENWRIRLASVQLLGDLLFKLSGVSGKGTTEALDEDETFGTEVGARTLAEKLGESRRKHMLSRLCMSRCDISLQVRQHAGHVWKLVVINTPRTLREILEPLLHLLLTSLHSESSDVKEIAARALGDVVRKLGERLLHDLVPILEKDLQSTIVENREGVCLALQEVLRNSPRETIENCMESIVAPLRLALCDSKEGVRSSAAQTANLLVEKMGSKAMQELLNHIIPQLDKESTTDNALGALKELLLVRGRMVMPILLPQLISPKVNTKAFSYLADVAGESLTKHLDKLVPSLAKAVEESLDTANEQLEVQQCATVLFSIRDPDGVRIIIRCLTIVSNTTQPSAKRACLLLLTKYLVMIHEVINADSSNASEPVKAAPAAAAARRPAPGRKIAVQSDSDEDSDEDDDDDDDDYEEDSDDSSDDDDNLLDLGEVIGNFYPDILRASVLQLAMDDDDKLLRQAYHCTVTCIQAWKAEHYNIYLNRLHNLLEMAISERRQILIRQGKLAKGDNNFQLPGFAINDLGVEPFMNAYRDAILQGNSDTKELAAVAMYTCVAHASPKALEKSVVRAAGPLIRVMGDRSCLNFKATMVDTLGIMVQKCPASMRPFATQLQSTFLRTLMDPLRTIRIASVRALSHILPENKKVDALFTDLVTNYCQANSDFRDTSLEVLRLCLASCWPNLSEKCRTEIHQWIPSAMQQLDFTGASEKEHVLIAAVMAEYCKLRLDLLPELVLGALKDVTPRLWQLSHATAYLLILLFRDIPEKLLDPKHTDKEFREQIQKGVKFFCQNDQVPVCVGGFKAWAFAVKYLVFSGNQEELQIYMPLIQRGIKHENNEVKRAAIRSCIFVGIQCRSSGKFDLFVRPILASLVNGTRERDSVVRAISEQGVADVCGLSTVQKSSGTLLGEDESDLSVDGKSLYEVYLNTLDQGLKNSVQELAAKIKKLPVARQACPILDDIKLVE